MKKAILYLDGGFRVPVDIINYPPPGRKMRLGKSLKSA